MRLWDVPSRRLLNRYQAQVPNPPARPVQGVAFSPDGRLAVSSHWESVVRLWDLDKGKELYCFEGHIAPVMSAVFTPDGRYALSGARNDRDPLRLWDLSSRKQERGLQPRFIRYGGSSESVALNHNGKRAVSGGGDWVVRLWDVETGREMRVFEGHTKTVWSVCFTPDGRSILSGSEDGSIRLWDVESGRELHRFEGHQGGVRSITVSADGRFVLSGSNDKTIRLWELPKQAR
jgi:WD40 repeat protein